MHDWINPGRYVSGRELAAAGMAELVEFNELHTLQFPPVEEVRARAAAGAAGKSHRPAVAPAARRRPRRK
jgi:hypothetical protein